MTTTHLHFKSAKGGQLLARPTTFTLIFGSQTLTASDPQFIHAVNQAVAPIQHHAHVVSIQTPYSGDTVSDPSQVSSNGHYAAVNVVMNESVSAAANDYDNIRSQISSHTLSISAAGEVPTQAAFSDYSQTDLERSASASLPAALILLLVVFGTAVAAVLCLGVGVLAIFAGLAGVYTLSHLTTVSSYSLNIVNLIGLGVAIDYSLFVASRFREELALGATVADAIETTMATAGRAILFSGLTVAIGLSGLLLYPGSFLVSLGLSGALVVIAAVAFAVTFLPALLSFVGHGVDRLRVPWIGGTTASAEGWRKLANAVMHRPLLFLLPAVALLLAAGSPFTHLQLVSSDVQQLPTSAEAHQGADLLKQQFPAQGQSTYSVVVHFDGGSVTSANNVATAYSLSQRLAALPNITGVRSYVSVLGRGANVAQYQSLYTATNSLAPDIAAQLKDSTSGSVADIDLFSSLDPQSQGARDMVSVIRNHDTVAGATTYVTGGPAFDYDFFNFIASHTLWAVLVVVGVTLVALFILLRSIVLPIKAVLMNLLSISAAFGALVWVIQDGHLTSLLSFNKAPIDPTLPPIMFCLIFGLSMDYEVFLLTRMQESWEKHGDNRRAVADGLQTSGRLVTGAAVIMIAVFASFAIFPQVVVVKAVGVGLATAILVDATIVRALVVPSLMRLLGRANWWAPRWLLRLLPSRPVTH